MDDGSCASWTSKARCNTDGLKSLNQGNIGLSFILSIPTVFRNTLPSMHFVLIYGVARIITIVSRKIFIMTVYNFLP